MKLQLSAACLFAFLAPLASADERPNVLFIAVDDLRPELGCYGAAHVESPHIDRLARAGVTFTRAYCQLAACNASRASLMTGLRPDTLRVWDLRTDFRTTRPAAVTLAQQFKRSGYHTAAIGKIFHNTLPDPLSWSEPKLHIAGYPFDPDAVYRSEENIAGVARKRATLVAQGREKRHIDRLGEWYIKTVATENAGVPDDAYFDGAQTTVAIEKLGAFAKREKPFFLGVGYYRPHLPFNAPRRYWEMYEREEIPLAEHGELPAGAPPMAINTMRELRGYEDFKGASTPHEGPLDEAQARLLRHGYLASVSYVDAQVGRLLDALERLELRERTIVVLWGDHGWKLGEHRSWCKMTNYEVDTRVPLIVAAPGARENGKACTRLVELVDLYPTLCELAGIEAPTGLEGLSFAPLLADRHRPWKRAVFSQFLRQGIWIAPDGVEYMGYAMRTERYRYVEWLRWEDRVRVARELYDHARDPHELHNLAADPDRTGLMESFAALLAEGWRAGAPK